MKIEDFKTLDVVTFEDGTKGIVYEVPEEMPYVVSLTKHSWDRIRSDNCGGFRSPHGKIAKVESKHSIGSFCEAASENAFGWLKPKRVVWEAKQVLNVNIGNTTATVSSGTWVCQGAAGDINDAEKVLELFTEPDKPSLEAYDLVQIGEDTAHFAMIVPSPDPHESKFAAVYGRIVQAKWHADGQYDFVLSTDEIPDGDVNKIWRWNNKTIAFKWFNCGSSIFFKAKEIWARKQTVRIANTWDARRIGDVVKIGCQEVTLQQVEELIRACKSTMPK
jgi:hypothetical protein